MPFIVGFAGYSGSGKTTLITRLIPLLQHNGRRVAVIKHDGHGHYKEIEGSDSMRLLSAGADCVIVSGASQVARIERPKQEYRLEQLIAELPAVDIVLVEGYKLSEYAKIAVILRADQVEVLHKIGGSLLAIAAGCDKEQINAKCTEQIPVFHIDDHTAIAAYLEAFISV